MSYKNTTPGPGAYEFHSSFEKFDNMLLSVLNGSVELSRSSMAKSSLENPMKRNTLL